LKSVKGMLADLKEQEATVPYDDEANVKVVE
jgi:hypothetical protein